MGTEYARFKVATGLATSIFFYSFSGGERKGVTTQRLRLAFLRQGIPATIVTDALRRLEDELWFLHFEKNFYYFSNIVGLNRVVIDKEEAVKDEDIEEEVKQRIDKIKGTDFDVYLWPKTNSDIPVNIGTNRKSPSMVRRSPTGTPAMFPAFLATLLSDFALSSSDVGRLNTRYLRQGTFSLLISSLEGNMFE